MNLHVAFLKPIARLLVTGDSRASKTSLQRRTLHRKFVKAKQPELPSSPLLPPTSCADCSAVKSSPYLMSASLVSRAVGILTSVM